MLVPTGQFDRRFIARAQKFSIAAGIFSILLGCVVFSGWVLNLDPLKTVFGTVAVKANTALLLILAGGSLCLVNSHEKNRTLWIASQISAAFVGLVGLLTLTQHLTGWNFGIDQLLFPEAAGAWATTSPGRMGPPASTCFMLAGIALVLFEQRKYVHLRQSFCVFICVWALLAILGYVYDAEQLYQVPRFTGIALPTAIALFILGLGLLSARVNEGVTRILSADDAGGLMARRLMLMVVAVPFLLGWAIVSGQHLGYYDLGFGIALLVLLIIVIFAFAVWQSSASLNYAEQLRAATEVTLREKEEGLRLQASLINLSYEPILIWDIDAHIIEWNQGCEQLYGYDRATALGQDSHDLLKTQFPVSRAEFEQTLKRDRQWSGILRHETRDGREVWVESRQQLIESDGRELVLETNRDITKQIEAEESGLRLAAIVTSSNDAIIGKTLDGTITSWNEGATRIFGYTPGEVLGQSITILIPKDRSDEEPAIIERLKRGEVVDHYETVRVRKDGSMIDISLTISPIRNSLGKIIGASKVARDITESKRAEAERERLLEREQAARTDAETANRVKDEFLATVSHELRTPLNAILGWSSMLAAGKLGETDAQYARETIIRNARSQAQIIEDILDVSRTVSGKLRLDVKPIELISVIKAAIDVVSPAAEAKGVQLQLLLDPLADRIQGDAARMQQVIWNLLTNAVKFTPKGGQVEVKLKRVDSCAEISVSDTGEGIGQEFLPFVFDRFHQADGSTTRRHGGLGLGLAIARHLVEMHGGTITASSEGKDRGATFVIRIPISTLRTDQTEPIEIDAAPSQPGRNGQLNLKGLRILAIDDEADAREMLQTLFEEYGAEILTVSSAREGLETIAGWKPHVLISDIGMPDEDGYTFIRKVRALPDDQGANIPAIALTGYVRVEERMRALEAGFQMFVPKPVETNELISLVADLCREQERN
jgi:PAS domain S-box-containing protein